MTVAPDDVAKLPNTAQIFETPKIIVLLLLFTLQNKNKTHTQQKKYE